MGKDGWILAIKSIKKAFQKCPFRLFNKAVKTVKAAECILKVDLTANLALEQATH
jgi:hypothetical protein